MIVLGGPGDYLFLRAPSFFAVCIKGFTCRLVGRISLLTGCDAMFAYEIFLRNCSLPIALVYTSFLFWSIFLALNTINIMLSVDNIKRLDLEISSNCVASCPFCPRNFYGMKHNAGYTVTSISLENFKKIFNEQFVSRLEHVRFNGNFGDFNTNPEAVEIVEYLRHNNRHLDIDIHTNGHSRDSDFWKKLAKSDPMVHFALDGLQDTHHLHRIGTSWSRVMKNAQTFIDAGGRATWKMIVFEHNKHQVSQCSELAKDMNFRAFELANDGRDNAFVFDDNGNHSHTIGSPPHRKPVDAHELLQWKAEHDWQVETEEKKIVCQALKEKRIFMSSTGDIFP